MNINFYLYVYQHIISINIFHQQKTPSSKTKKKLRPNNLSNYSGANHSLFPFTNQHRPPQLHLGSSCFLISVI